MPFTALMRFIAYINSIFLVKYKKVFPQGFLNLIPYIKALSIDELLNFKPKKKQKIDVI